VGAIKTESSTEMIKGLLAEPVGWSEKQYRYKKAHNVCRAMNETVLIACAGSH